MNTQYKQILLTVIFGLSAVSSSKAIIGEDSAECYLRYGSPIGIDGDKIRYKKDPYLTTVEFYEGKAAFITTRKEVEAAFEPTKFEPFSDEEIAAFLRANSKTSPWKEKPPKPDDLGRKWETEDGKLTAAYGMNILSVMSAEELSRSIERYKTIK